MLKVLAWLWIGLLAAALLALFGYAMWVSPGFREVVGSLAALLGFVGALIWTLEAIRIVSEPKG